MIDGCPGCFQNAKGQQEAFETKKTEAKEYAKEQKKPMAIYKEGGEYKILEAFAAYRAGLGPVIREVVSVDQPADDG